jgi:hypothetical protein
MNLWKRGNRHTQVEAPSGGNRMQTCAGGEIKNIETRVQPATTSPVQCVHPARGGGLSLL